MMASKLLSNNRHTTSRSSPGDLGLEILHVGIPPHLALGLLDRVHQILSSIGKPPGDIRWDVIVDALVVGSPLDSLVVTLFLIAEPPGDTLLAILILKVTADSSLLPG